MLHEIGHYIDFTKTPINKRLNRFTGAKMQKCAEKDAWKYGIRLSDKYNIPINYVAAKKWLSSYKTEYIVLNK